MSTRIRIDVGRKMVTICLIRTDLGRVSSDVFGLGIWNGVCLFDEACSFGLFVG